MIKLVKSAFYEEAETKRKLARFIIEEGTFSMGRQCRKFEESFARKQGRKHAVFVANGSVANLLLIQAMMNLGRFGPGDRIGFSALTWPTNVMPLIQLGLQPVPIDCEISTLNISTDKIAGGIEKLDGLFVTNVLGFCDNLPAISELCSKSSVILLEDNCESLGSRCDGRRLGNFGMAATFSFFIGHHLSTIEGGMVVTDDDELFEQLVMGRAHGWDRNLSADSQSRLRKDAGIDAFYSKYTFYDLASNFRPTEISGFLGNTQIEYWDEIVARRAANYAALHWALAANDNFFEHSVRHMDLVSNFAMPVICKTSQLANAYRKRFMDAGVEIRPVIAGNMTKQPFYRKYNPEVEAEANPNSDLIHDNGFYFGNNPELTVGELELLQSLLLEKL